MRRHMTPTAHSRFRQYHLDKYRLSDMKRFLEAGCAFRRGTGAGRSGPKLKTQLGSTRDSLPNRAVALNQRPDQPRRRPDGGGEPPRAPDPELASNQRRQPPARHHARHRPDHRQRDRGERAGRQPLPLCPSVRSMAWADAEGAFQRRQGPPDRDQQAGRRLHRCLPVSVPPWYSASRGRAIRARRGCCS